MADGCTQRLMVYMEFCLHIAISHKETRKFMSEDTTTGMGIVLQTLYPGDELINSAKPSESIRSRIASKTSSCPVQQRNTPLIPLPQIEDTMDEEDIDDPDTIDEIVQSKYTPKTVDKAVEEWHKTQEKRLH